MSFLSLFFKHPYNIKPARKQESRLLLISGKGLLFYYWREGKRFELQGHFPHNKDGWQFFEDELNRQSSDSSPIFVIVDVVEEELRSESIPPIYGEDRRLVLQRRMERLFHNTPYRRAAHKGRGEGNKERILFSALINPDLITPWMQRLQTRKAPVAGIWSLQLLSRQLLQKIDSKSMHSLLVTLHFDGLRQTFFRTGRTIISRKTPLPRNDNTDLVEHMRQEILRTRSYLLSLRLLKPHQPLDIFLVLPKKLSNRIPAEGLVADGVRFNIIYNTKIEEQIGMQQQEAGFGSELLYCQLLLLRPPRNHYGRPDELQYYSTNPLQRLSTFFNSIKIKPLIKPEQEAIKGPVVRRLGDVLIEKELLSQDQLQAALTEQKSGDRTLGKVLIDMGMVSETEVRETLADLLQHESVDLTEVLPQPTAIALVTKSFAQRHSVLPLLYDEEAQVLTVAMSNPMNVAALDLLLARLEPGVQIKPLLAGEVAITGAVDRLYESELSVEGVLRELETGELELDSLSDISDESFSHPMVRLVNALLHDAVKRGASDIHIGPTSGFLRIRYRIDGILHQIYSVHKKLLSSIVVRIKVMGEINIAETRLPQTGQISFPYLGQTVNFRVSIQPTINGENIVLRVLDLSQEIRSLEEIGVSAHNLQAMYSLLQRPGGLVVVTGPTGSGKTTSLYSMLNHLNEEGVNIMTMEDPVEYPMPTILQTSINHEAGLDYAVGIKALLWQDPDIILVGEVHDQETANMALQAAMTGHMVFTTLHANSILGTLPRMLNLGVSHDFISGNINSILSQRLVRKLCKKCRKPEPIQMPEAKMLGLKLGDKT
jgi:type II secretory ATPase GspE/PulE/Tfp pilus assembly ATPase PilB-like protein